MLDSMVLVDHFMCGFPRYAQKNPGALWATTKIESTAVRELVEGSKGRRKTPAA
jgi:hypothetical protein